MDFLPPDLTAYAEAYTSPEPQLLQHLSRQTRAQVMAPRMLSGHMQGRFLSMLSHMIRPQRILEIGTYTGYSALCLAEGLADGGQLITLEANEELETIARTYWQQSAYADRIELRIGNAVDILPTLTDTFELVFVDADKRNLNRYYELVFPKLRVGGFMLIDNVLWSGKVTSAAAPNDLDTVAVQNLNNLVQNDVRVENVLLPIRDGLMLVRKLTD